MNVTIHLNQEDETKALPILLRHSSGMILPERTYVISEEAVRALRRAGVRFAELSHQTVPSLEELAGERG